MSPRPGVGARQAALSLLAAVLDGRHNLSEAEPGLPAADRDRAFARHLAYGVLRWLPALEWLGRQLLQHPLKRRDRDVQRLVLQGLFELWQNGSAPHAAIHESAECARALGKPWAVGLVNAVLRRFQRERADLLVRLEMREERFAHPEWLLHRLRSDWPDDWQQIVAANNGQAPLWLRLNRNAIGPDPVVLLSEAGFEATPHPIAPDALRVEPAAAVDRLPGFADGLFSVQDPAAQLAAGLLELRDGQQVLDACAAPGGKTCHILETCPGVRLTALDRIPDRMERIRENLDRIGFGAAAGLRLAAADATDTPSWWDGVPFDRILLDAPCSATGVIRRHPEIKVLRTQQQVTEAAELQAVLLERLWPLLKPGGILLYATCSILRVENPEQVAQFAGRHADAEPFPIRANWGRELSRGRQILPGEQEMDGFYYARLRKNP